jgi:superfamily I DNA/RNA helicase
MRYCSISCTVHQAKGREWDRVKLGNDFNELLTSTADKLQKELKENCTCNKLKQQHAGSSSTKPYKSAPTQQNTKQSTAAITTQSQSVQFTASSQVATTKCVVCKELLELKDLPVDHWRHHTPSELREQAACVLFVALTRAKRELKLNSVVLFAMGQYA